MKELIGRRCRAIFGLPANEWPIEGWPAWVVVEAVAMPMVKMRSLHGTHSVWVNAGVIKTIEDVDKRKSLPWWKRALPSQFGDGER